MNPPLATPTWTRSERPDGHRSLWCHVGRWIVVEPGGVGGIGAACVYVGPRGDARTFTSTVGMEWITERWGCPVPTAEDLAWLRGDG